MSKLIPLAVLTLAACSSKPTWTEFKKDPVTMMFPCKPNEVANTNTVKCTTSDGTEWRLESVDKRTPDAPTPPPEAILAEAKEYADQIPNGEIIQMETFPVKWRETRRTSKVEAWLFYKSGWEYTAAVSYSTPQPPALSTEFFSKVQVQ